MAALESAGVGQVIVPFGAFISGLVNWPDNVRAPRL